MTSFELGFLKEASVGGLSRAEAVHLLKRAMDHSEAHQLFKSLPSEQEEQEEQSYYALDNLSALLKQELIDRHMSAAKHKINF